MKTLFYFFFLTTAFLYAQDSISVTFIKEVKQETKTIVSIDDFGIIYYINNDVFYKKDTNKTISYNNLQLGKLHTVNTFNPLKINLFYKNFNTFIILDNRLAEIYRIDFNQITPYKNISHISTGYDNTVWVFNQDLQRLELFDYKTKATRIHTTPVQSKVLDIKSNYNYCWLLTEQFLYTYNYFGRLIKKIKNTGYTAMAESSENIILKKNNTLYCLNKDNNNIVPIKTPDLLINDFFVTNETLYIYNNKNIQEFNLKTN